MCEANAYLLKDGREELVMESVDVVEAADIDTWRLINIFGAQKMVKGIIKGMNLVDHKIWFEAETD